MLQVIKVSKNTNNSAIIISLVGSFVHMHTPLLPSLTDTISIPLLSSDYVYDVINMLSAQGLSPKLSFRKLVWCRPICKQNTLYVDVLYHQVRQEVE